MKKFSTLQNGSPERASENPAETPRRSLMKRWVAWLQLRKLERELRDSEQFQKKCEKLRCFSLAESEENYQKQIREQISRL